MFFAARHGQKTADVHLDFGLENRRKLVRVVGLEPTLLAETEFESVASTIPPHPHIPNGRLVDDRLIA